MNLKLVYFGVVALLSSAPVFSQTRAYAANVALGLEGNSVNYTLPMTTLKVRVITEQLLVRKGPYARYAQKYLGVTAPLSDKTLYSIVGASLGYFEEADPTRVYTIENPEKSVAKIYSPTAEGFTAVQLGGNKPVALRFNTVSEGEYQFKDLGIHPIVDTKKVTTYSNVQSDSGMVAVPVDRYETVEKSLEEMAENAAKAIFTLRKRRYDLVSGEAGENVFGTGLTAAIQEMNRLEEEYLALFLGKQFSQQIVKEFEITPDSGKMNVVVCRFSELDGITDDANLSARPVVLQLLPELKTQRTVAPRKGTKDSRGTVFYRIADIVNCKLVDGKNVLVMDRIPIYQFGTVVEIPVTSLK